MTRYEPHCDCLGGHVSMVPDPNGRWCRADEDSAEMRIAINRVPLDPSLAAEITAEVTQFLDDAAQAPPVADDPSGIVQQMPEGDLAELRDSIPAGPWIKLHGMANATVCPSDQYDAFMRGDLVQGYLRIVHDGDPRDQVCVDIASAIAMLPDLLDEVIARRATEADLRAEVERLRAALIKINVGNGWAALIARTALYPETDGGQDGA